MKKELRDAIANLVRHYERMHIDLFHLLGLAMKAQKGLAPLPESIIKELGILRELPESKERIEQTEKLLADIFRQADDDQLTQLLLSFVKEKDQQPN